MTAASPKTWPSALRSPLPPSIARGPRPSSVAHGRAGPAAVRYTPRRSRWSPGATRAGPCRRPRDRQDDDHRLLGHHDAVHEQRRHLEPVQPPRQVLSQPLPSPPHDEPTGRDSCYCRGRAARSAALQIALVVARRHPGEGCCIIRAGRGSRSRDAATEGDALPRRSSAVRGDSAPAHADRRR